MGCWLSFPPFSGGGAFAVEGPVLLSSQSSLLVKDAQGLDNSSVLAASCFRVLDRSHVLFEGVIGGHGGGTRQHRVLCPLLQQYVPCCRGCSPQRQWSLEFGSSLPCGLPEGGGTSVRYPPALLVQFVAQHPPKLCGG